MKDLLLTYIANAGVMVQVHGKKILFDPLTKPGNELYKDTEPVVRDRLLKNEAPYENIDLILVTHHHRDHFHDESVYAMMIAQPQAVLISTPEVLRRVKALDHSGILDHSRFAAPELALYGEAVLTVKDMTLRIRSTLHDGEDYQDVENFVFLLDAGFKVAHLGDSKPAYENFMDLWHAKTEGIDLLIVNFPYVTLPSARKLVQDLLMPAQLAVVHFPDPDKPGARWTEVAKKSFGRVKDSYLPTVLLESLGQTMTLPQIQDKK